MTEIPIIFLVFVLIWVAVIVCCRSFSSDEPYSERLRRRTVLLGGQQQALRQVQIPNQSGRNYWSNQERNENPDIRVTPLRVTTISRGNTNVAMDFYEIQLPTRQTPRTNLSSQTRLMESSPPPFNTAYLVSSPVVHPDDPPPTYEECLKGNKKESLQPITEPKITKDIENYI